MLLRPTCGAFVRQIAPAGMAAALRGISTVHSPPKRGTRERSEAKTAQKRNGHAGWNPGRRALTQGHSASIARGVFRVGRNAG